MADVSAETRVSGGTPELTHGTSWSVPRVFVLRPHPQPPLKADHHVVCDVKIGASPPEAQLRAELIEMLDACAPEVSDHYWEKFDPIPWLDPGPLRRLSRAKRDVLISLGIGELAQNLSNPTMARRLERLAGEATLDAARAVRSRVRRKSVPARDFRASIRSPRRSERPRLSRPRSARPVPEPIHFNSASARA